MAPDTDIEGDDLQNKIRKLFGQLFNTGVEYLVLTVGVSDWSVYSTGSDCGENFVKENSIAKQFLDFCKANKPASPFQSGNHPSTGGGICSGEEEVDNNDTTLHEEGSYASDVDKTTDEIEKPASDSLSSARPKHVRKKVCHEEHAYQASVVRSKKLRKSKCKKQKNKRVTKQSKIQAEKLDRDGVSRQDDIVNPFEVSESNIKTEISENTDDYEDAIVDEYQQGSILHKELIQNTTENKEHRCDDYGKSYQSSYRLREHQKLKHRVLEQVENAVQTFSCDLCSCTFSKSSYLKFHKLLHQQVIPDNVEVIEKDRTKELLALDSGSRNQEKMTCSVCDTTFNRTLALLKHFVLEHTRSFKCQVCCTSADGLQEIKDHMLYHREPLNQPKTKAEEIKINIRDNLFACSLCTKTFNFKSTAKRHIEIMHLKSRVQKWDCEICGSKFWDRFSLNRHKEIHKQRDLFICPENGCKKSYWTQKSLDNHARTHRDSLCDFCGKSFKSEYLLRCHTSVHTSNKNFKCNVCGKFYKSRNTLCSHMRSHDLSKWYICELCGKVFKSHSHFYSHKLMHNDIRNFKCSVCNKAYRKRPSLNMHKLAQKHFADGESPDEMLFTECDICHKRFIGTKDSYQFTRHMAVHSTEKVHTCSVCGKGFKTFCNLKHHQMWHTGNAPECSMCGRSFRSFRKLQQHVTESHKEDSEEPSTGSSIENVSGDLKADSANSRMASDTAGNSKALTSTSSGIVLPVHNLAANAGYSTVGTFDTYEYTQSVSHCKTTVNAGTSEGLVDVPHQFPGHTSTLHPSMQQYIQQTPNILHQTEHTNESFQTIFVDVMYVIRARVIALATPNENNKKSSCAYRTFQLVWFYRSSTER